MPRSRVSCLLVGHRCERAVQQLQEAGHQVRRRRPPTRRRRGPAAAARSTSPRRASRRPRSGPPGGPGGPRRRPARRSASSGMLPSTLGGSTSRSTTAAQPATWSGHMIDSSSVSSGTSAESSCSTGVNEPGGAGLVEAHLRGQRGSASTRSPVSTSAKSRAGWSQPADGDVRSISSTAEARAGSGSGPSVHVVDRVHGLVGHGHSLAHDGRSASGSSTQVSMDSRASGMVFDADQPHVLARGAERLRRSWRRAPGTARPRRRVRRRSSAGCRRWGRRCRPGRISPVPAMSWPPVSEPGVRVS